MTPAAREFFLAWVARTYGPHFAAALRVRYEGLARELGV